MTFLRSQASSCDRAVDRTDGLEVVLQVSDCVGVPRPGRLAVRSAIVVAN